MMFLGEISRLTIVYSRFSFHSVYEFDSLENLKVGDSGILCDGVKSTEISHSNFNNNLIFSGGGKHFFHNI